MSEKFCPPLTTLPRNAAATGLCSCRCHVQQRGDYLTELDAAVRLSLRALPDLAGARHHALKAVEHRRAAERREHDRLGTDTANILEAAAACPSCIDGHCAALSGRPEELDWTPCGRRVAAPKSVAVQPWKDSAPPIQFGGSTDGGEGAE